MASNQGTESEQPAKTPHRKSTGEALMAVATLAFCQSCGAKLSSDSDFCETCGAKLTSTEWISPTPVALTGQAWDEAVEKNTVRFWKALDLPTWEQINNPKRRGTAQHEIVCGIIGSPESGKSTRLDAIIAHMREVYGAENVVGQIIDAADFHKILDAKSWPRKPIQVIGLDDCSGVKFTRPELIALWKLRHRMTEKTGLSRGLILLVFCGHNYFGLQKELREDPNIVYLLLDVPDNPLNPSDSRITRFLIPNKEDRDWLANLAHRRLDDPAICGYAWLLERGGHPGGFIYLAAPETKEEPKPRHWPRLTLPTVHRAPKFEEKSTIPEVEQRPEDRSGWKPERTGLLLVGIGVLTLVLVYLFRFVR